MNALELTSTIAAQLLAQSVSKLPSDAELSDTTITKAVRTARRIVETARKIYRPPVKKRNLKRLCVFYDSPSRRTARDFLGKSIEWIVCKECQKQLRHGKKLHSSLSEPFSKYAE